MTDTRKIEPAVIEAALRVMREAMEITSEGHAHVFVRYAAHVATLSVDAQPVNTDYRFKVLGQKFLLDRTVYLDRGDSEESLAQLLRQVSALRKTAKA